MSVHDNRLTSSDVARMTEAIDAAVTGWDGANVDAAAMETLYRIGAHAIGCGLHDLRPVEVEQLHRLAYERVFGEGDRT